MIVNSSKALWLIAILAGIIFSSCKSPSENDNDIKNPGTYIVTSLNNMDVDAFTEQNSQWENYDWPLIIKLTNELTDTVYTGSVQLFRLGWVEIDRNCTYPQECFILDTKGKLGPVEDIVFSKLDISSTSMEGLFTNAGPTLDVTGVQFSASVE